MGLLDANQILKIYRFLDRFRPVMSSGFWYRRPLQLKRGAGSKFSRLISSRAVCSTCQGKKDICQIKWKLSRICSMRKGGTMSNQKKVISFRSNQTCNESHRRVVLSAYKFSLQMEIRIFQKWNKNYAVLLTFNNGIKGRKRTRDGRIATLF